MGYGNLKEFIQIFPFKIIVLYVYGPWVGGCQETKKKRFLIKESFIINSEYFTLIYKIRVIYKFKCRVNGKR